MRQILPLLVFFVALSVDHSTARLLRVVSNHVEPFFQPTSGEPEGYLVDLVQDLVARLNTHLNSSADEVTYRFYRSPDGKYGHLDQQTGQWTGLIGEVVKGEADVAVAPLTINTKRLQYVYFSHPFMAVSLVPLVKKPAPGAPMPFSGLRDLLAKVQAGNLTVGYIQNGATENFMSNHKMDIVRAIYNASKAASAPSPYVESYTAGVQRVRDDPKFLLFGEHTALYQSVLQQPCDVAVAWSAVIGEGYYGFAFPKTPAGRQLTDRFNEVIVAAQQDGTTEKLFKRWWWEKSTCPEVNLCVCHGQGGSHAHPQ